MKFTSEPVNWECAECGTKSETSFGISAFVCPACGYEASGDDARATYINIREKFLARADLHFLYLCPFENVSDDISPLVLERISSSFPFLGTSSLAGDCSSWFDVLWIMHGAPDLAIDLPLQTISEYQWFRFRDVSDSPLVIFATAVACKDDGGVSFQCASLSWEERILSNFGWSRWTKVQRDKIARRLHDSVISCSKTSAIPSFSFDTQLNLWRIDPTTPKIDVASLVPLFDSTDAVSAISSGLLKSDILESVQFDSWKPQDWLALLKQPQLTLPEKAIKEIRLRWIDFSWSAETLSDLIEQNDEARRVFPELPSSMMAEMLSLHPEFASWMSKEGWFNRLSSQDWMPLLANEAVFLQKPVRDYAAKAVLPGLSCADREELIRNNLGIAVFYPAASLSEPTLVELYVSGRHDDYFQSNGFSFSGLSVDSWISLLARCGKRVPVETAGFFLKESGRKETPTVEKLLTKNPKLLPFLSKDQFSRLTTETFLHFCKKTGAPDFLVSAYPVQKWTPQTQRDFLVAYPWTEKYFDWHTWPIWQIDNLVRDNWMLGKAYPHKFRLLVFRHWKWISAIAVTLAIAGWGIAFVKATPVRRDIQLSRERERVADNARIISENTRVTEEVRKQRAEAESIKAQADKEKAQANLETQLSEERVKVSDNERTISINTRETEEARKKRAENEAIKAQADKDKSQADLETQLSKERVKVSENERTISDNKRVISNNERATEEARKNRAEAEARKAEADAKALEVSVEKQKLEAEVRDRFKKLCNAVLDSLLQGDSRSARKLLKEIETETGKENEAWFSTASKFVEKLEMAKDGDAEAALWIGNQFATGNGLVAIRDDAVAIEWFKKAAKEGNARAMRSLGVFYKEGRGGEKNEAKAFEWYRKAFEAGDYSAGYYLGKCYLEGIGVRKSQEKAFLTFQKGAEMGSDDARYILGQLLYYGIGCEKDRYAAVAEIRKAKGAGSTLKHMDWLLK